MTKLVALEIGVLLLLTSCTGIISTLNETTLLVHVKQSARTIEATLGAVTHYEAKLTPDPGPDRGDIEVSNLNQEDPIVLATGWWTVLVSAFDGNGHKIGEGWGRIEVKAGTNSVSILTGPLKRSTGSFDVVIEYAEVATGLEFILSPWPDQSENFQTTALQLIPTTELLPLTVDQSFLTDATYKLDLNNHRAEFKGTLKSGDYMLLAFPTTSSGRKGTYGEILRIYDFGAAESTLSSPSFFVNFDAGRGTLAMDPQPIPFGLSSALSPQKFTPPLGEVFAGWKEGNATTLISDEASYTMKSDHDVTLTAQWVVPQLTFTWSFALPDDPELLVSTGSGNSSSTDLVVFNSKEGTLVILTASSNFGVGTSYAWYANGDWKNPVSLSKDCILVGSKPDVTLDAGTSRFLVVVKSPDGRYYSKEFWVKDLGK